MRPAARAAAIAALLAAAGCTPPKVIYLHVGMLPAGTIKVDITLDPNGSDPADYSFEVESDGGYPTKVGLIVNHPVTDELTMVVVAYNADQCTQMATTNLKTVGNPLANDIEVDFDPRQCWRCPPGVDTSACDAGAQGDGGAPDDAGGPGNDANDGGPAHGDAGDAGAPDAGAPDAGAPDAGAPDAAGSDAAVDAFVCPAMQPVASSDLTTPECQGYCRDLEGECPTRFSAFFFNSDDCLGKCYFFGWNVDSNPQATGGDTITCRTNAIQKGMTCPNLGLGSMNGTCANGCAVYCNLRNGVCDPDDNCLQKCSQLDPSTIDCLTRAAVNAGVEKGLCPIATDAATCARCLRLPMN
jgi:hypothetical protein